MSTKGNTINWVAVFAILITLSLYLTSALSSIKESVYENTGNIKVIQTDMNWVKGAIEKANDGDLSYIDNPVMRLFVKK